MCCEEKQANYFRVGLASPPSFRQSFQGCLQAVRQEKEDMMGRLIRLTGKEMALERILDEPPTV